MEILHYTEKHNIFRERLRSFLKKEVTPFAEEWEQNKIVPKSVWQKMGQQGFLCYMLKPEYGGLGGDFLYSIIVSEEMIRTLQSGLTATLHSDIIVPYIDSFGTEAIKQKYLPKCASGEIITAVAMTEPDAGSDLANIKTSAVEDNNYVLINGSKTFISNGINCDLVIVAARDPEIPNPYEALSLYIVEDGTPGFNKGQKLVKMGMHSQDTAEMFFNNCRIPVTNRLGEKGQGFLLLMQKLQQERLVCSIGAVAASEYLMEYLINYCKTHTDIDGKPLSKFQSTQFKLVEMMTEVKLGRTFMEKLVADHMEGKGIVIETSMCKYWTTDLVKRLAYDAIDLIGLPAMLDDHPITRMWRDVRIMSIFAGTNEIMKGIAGKFMGL
ncbi:MAG: acyl-CoA dehydrogenase family protein [Candidatus Magnetomorum sp.]|nr:acyl-CoA dehydrogenase family protein [Candidatus Magnetomorum sp.]